MAFLEDPIILVFMFLVVGCGFVALRPQKRSDFWLFLLTVLLFALPRAGIVLRQVNLPLPVAYPLVVIFVLEWFLLRRQRPHERSRIGYFFLIYAAAAGLGLAIGLSTGGNHFTAFLELCFYLFAILLFFYVSETFGEPRHFLLFSKMILVLSIVVSLYGIAQFYFGAAILIESVTYNSATSLASSYLINPASKELRVLSSYGDPNVLASQLIVFVGIALALLIGKKIPWQQRLFYAAVLAVNILCLAFTRSRAGAICLIVVSLVILVWRWRWALAFVPLLAVMVWVMSSDLLQIGWEKQFYALGATDIRRTFPSMLWQLLAGAPLGCGLGNAVKLNWHGSGWTFVMGPTSTIWAGLNSFWLNLLSRLGVAGVMAFVLLLGALARYVWQHAKEVENPQVKAFLVGGLAGFVGQWIIWLVNNTYMLPGGGLNFWFMMGMLVAGCRAFTAQPGGLMVPVQPVSVAQPWPGGKKLIFQQ